MDTLLRNEACMASPDIGPDDMFTNSIVKDGMDSKELLEEHVKLRLLDAEVEAQSYWFDGIRVGYSDWVLTKDLVFDWKSDLDLVTLYFNLRGSSTTEIPAYDEAVTLGNYQHGMGFLPDVSGQIRSSDLRLTNFMIQFTVEKFMEVTADANDAFKRLKDSVIERKPVMISHANMYMDGNLLHAIDEIRHCTYKGGVKKIYLLSKCLELLARQAEAYQSLACDEKKFLKTAYDKEQVLYAREYLLEHMDNPPSLAMLSRLAGINEFKLKKGFKELFGNTVFGYLADKRLEIALREVREKQKPLREIAMDLGYSSVQHFSTAFKKKYGRAPSTFTDQRN